MGKVQNVSKKDKFLNEGYTIYIQGKNVQITDGIRNHVNEKLNKIDRFTDHILDIHVVLDVQKLSHTATIIMKFFHYNIQVHSTTGDLYSAIDGAIGKLTKLIRKYKKKLQNHRNVDLTTIDMNVNVLKNISEIDDINDEIAKENLIEEEKIYKLPKVVNKEALPLRTLTQEEAVMKLDLSGEHFLIYRGEEDCKLKVIYKRNDGNLGIVQVE